MNAFEFHNEDQGSGAPALVFLHYFAGSSRSWVHIVNSLSSRHRCIPIDLPGFANTPPLPDFSVEAVSDAVAAFIQRRNLSQYILIGHSMGGKLAMACASKKPIGLVGLVLVAPSPPTPEPMEESERHRLLNSHGDYAAAEQTLQSITQRSLTAEDKSICIDDNIRTSLPAWVWWLTSGSRENIVPEIRNIDCPVLVVGGTLDPVISPQVITTQITPIIPTAKYNQISGAGHLLPFEAPRELADTIQTFAERYVR
jgi:pimeloyl-ACP methyl ester carboxylesterase